MIFPENLTESFLFTGFNNLSSNIFKISLYLKSLVQSALIADSNRFCQNDFDSA